MLTIITGYLDKQSFTGNLIKFPVMHPDEKFLYAKELVEKSVNENIILLTYSSQLIECIDAWAEWLNIHVKFILYDGEGRKEIPYNEMYKIYRHLGKVYKKVNNLRIEIHWRKKGKNCNGGCGCD